MSVEGAIQSSGAVPPVPTVEGSPGYPMEQDRGTDSPDIPAIRNILDALDMAQAGEVAIDPSRPASYPRPATFD